MAQEAQFQFLDPSCKISKLVNTFIWENQMRVLDRPENSLNLNLIENLQNIMIKRYGKMEFTTNKTYTIQIQLKNKHVSNHFLTESMPKRSKEVLPYKGGHTKSKLNPLLILHKICTVQYTNNIFVKPMMKFFFYYFCSGSGG